MSVIQTSSRELFSIMKIRSMESWAASAIVAVVSAGCVQGASLEITGTVRYLDSGEPLRGAEVHLLLVGDQVPPNLPKIETSATTISDESGNYSFKTDQDRGYMIQLVPSDCRYLGDRMPVRVDSAERTSETMKVIVDLSTRVDQCAKD